MFDEMPKRSQVVQSTEASLFEALFLSPFLDLRPIVDPDGAGVQSLGGAQRSVHFAGPDARRQPVLIVIGGPDRIVSSTGRAA